MMDSNDLPVPTRDTLVDWLASASISGYLGLFAGTGFSKAATGGRAPGFEELLKQLASRLGLAHDFDGDDRYKRRSLPQIASQLLAQFEDVLGQKARANEKFKSEIAQLCNLVPAEDTAARLTEAIRGVRPSWIITTNYDLILEALIDDAESVLPSQPLVARPDRIPIYHLHGHRLYPESIKITEEDYVGLLGPIDYQRLKLPLLLLESTTLLLGYALGDINVRAAMEWSRSFRGDKGLRLHLPQGIIIQALHRGAPNPRPYFGPNGEYVLEIADIGVFLDEISRRRSSAFMGLLDYQESMQEFLAYPMNALDVSTDPEKRAVFLKILEETPTFSLSTRVIDFLNRALEPIWAKAREDKQFQHYDTYLGLILDILERINYERVNPSLLRYLADALDRVGWYIEPSQVLGSAFAASRTWLDSHNRVNDVVKSELKSYAETYDKKGLTKMLSLVDNPKPSEAEW